MHSDVAQKLIKLNHQFYQTFAEAFSATRQRLQPGVQRIFEGIPPSANLLDLGCGNGELARELERRGHQGSYLGLDFSESLLVEARRETPAIASFQQADLTAPDLDEHLSTASFDIILAFAVLHHIPGRELRLQLLQRVSRLLVPKGRFIHSNWQPLNSARLKARLQPWEAIELTESDVDPSDYLLDWRREGRGLRYVHQFNSLELEGLAQETGFMVIDTFSSDGLGGNLGLYGEWGFQR